MPTLSVLAHFQELDDPRVGPATRHQLLGIVAVAVCAVICGADTWVEVEAAEHRPQPPALETDGKDGRQGKTHQSRLRPRLPARTPRRLKCDCPARHLNHYSRATSAR
jgi:hypothetical protein